MIEFKLIKKSNKSKARDGILQTPDGIVETPAFVPVATQAAVRGLTSQEVKETGSQILISNTFHLHFKPGEEIVADNGGIHGFMNWDKPLMTDSGGFQVFSLGFGQDLGVGKILKYFPENGKESIDLNSKPKNLKITHDGVYFRSLVDGKDLFLGPKESMLIQQKLGADIIFAFDECTPPVCTKEYAKAAMSRTFRWAKESLDSVKSDQALFGIVQGSHFQDLREDCAKYINSLDFPGYGIGGDLGSNKEMMFNILDWTIPYLNEEKPRHLLGIGYLEDMENVIKAGVDLFDCTVPTHYGRRGIAFTSEGRLDLNNVRFRDDKNPIDKNCQCSACQTYRRNYVHHLFRAKEWLAGKLITFHNLYYFNNYVRNIREKIKNGKI